MNANSVTMISGVGSKGPACFLLDTGGKRIMLDLGYGPQPGLWPDLRDVGRVDALVLSHSHKDHIGALSRIGELGNPPIFTTAVTAARLPDGNAFEALPLRGQADILGIPVDTGRNGHAPGGIWIRFGVEDGFLYTGDYSTESALYAFDMPAPARVAIIDSSYGDDDTPLTERQNALLGELPSDAVLPAPADGRGPDIALFLQRAGRNVRLDDTTRQATRTLTTTAADSLQPGLEGVLAALADSAADAGERSGVTIATPADGSGGCMETLIGQWEHDATPAFLFTGYVPPESPADRLVKSGRGIFRRWSVHPRLRDTQALVRATGAAVVIPAFCDRKFLPALQAALQPARVTMDRAVTW